MQMRPRSFNGHVPKMCCLHLGHLIVSVFVFAMGPLDSCAASEPNVLALMRQGAHAFYDECLSRNVVVVLVAVVALVTHFRLVPLYTLFVGANPVVVGLR
jgi:hypothetical protein